MTSQIKVTTNCSFCGAAHTKDQRTFTDPYGVIRFCNTDRCNSSFAFMLDYYNDVLAYMDHVLTFAQMTKRRSGMLR